MARPRKNNLDLFRHEKDMRNDPKIKAARMMIGNFEGYCLYCWILEYMCDQEGLKIPLNEKQIKIMAIDFCVVPEMISKAIDLFTNTLDLFQVEDGFLICRQLRDRHSDFIGKRVSAAKTGVSDEKTIVSDGETGVSFARYNKIKEIKDKRKEIKEKEIKEKENKIIVLFDFWNSKPSLISHKSITTAMSKNLAARLDGNSIEELTACIENYSLILSSPEKYWYTYKHALDEFFRNGERKLAPYVKFLPERFVEENFLFFTNKKPEFKNKSFNQYPEEQEVPTI